MKNAEYVFQAKDEAGNSVDCIGVIFSLDLNRKLFDIEEVKREFGSRGIDTKKYFKDNKKASAFTDAIGAMTKYFKKQGFILHKVTDDNAQTVYALDKKIVNKLDKELVTSEDNSEITVSVDSATYENVANFIYDKGNDRVLTDSQERMQGLVRTLNLYINSYTKNKFSGKVNDIIEELGGCINWRRRGGVYFVPAQHRDTLYKVVEAVTALDSASKVKIGEVANLPKGRRAVSVSATEELGIRMDKLLKKLNVLQESGEITMEELVKIANEVAPEIKYIEQYNIITGGLMTKALPLVENIQELLKEGLITGKITKKIIEAPTIDDEVAEFLADL